MSTRTEQLEPLATALAEMFAEERQRMRNQVQALDNDVREALIGYKAEMLELKTERDELRREIEKMKAPS